LFFTRFFSVGAIALSVSYLAAAKEPLRTGKAAMGDWTEDAPGVRRKITGAGSSAA
jgi:hypothetical protein